jgi:hypothetical protein
MIFHIIFVPSSLANKPKLVGSSSKLEGVLGRHAALLNPASLIFDYGMNLLGALLGAEQLDRPVL